MMQCFAHRTGALLLVMLIWAFPAAAATDQTPDDISGAIVPPPAGRVRVYLDCGGQCFAEYLREEIGFVDFVQQPQDADVHVLATSQNTGGGGREVVLRFVGRGRFTGHDHDRRAVTMVGDTENTRREVVLETALVGLLDYVTHDGPPPGVAISVSADADEPPPPAVEDAWDLWVFSARLSGSVDEDERNRQIEGEVNFSADRVSEDWKISIGGRVSEQTETFDLDEADGEPFEVTRENRNINGFIAHSLGPHWSAGVRGRAASSTFNNNRLSISAAPAVEFNLFPYEEYATRELRVQYSLGPRREQYHEVTIFGKEEETLWQHDVSAVLDQRQPWGSLRAGFEFSQYLHDAGAYRLEGNGNVNLRIARGLSLNVNGGASRVRDQLSLPLRDATDEEVLLRIRQLQSGYQFRLGVGVTYSFGSIFNNIINPRFGT
jgi:hypothetical protein